MSTFPNFSNIAGYATKTLTDRRKGGPYAISKLNAWVRITSAVSSNSGDGLTMVSNPNFKLFGAAGVSSIYGNNDQSGTIGETWAGGAVNPSVGQGYRPSPIVESIEIDEGAGNLSRKASFSIKCFSKEQMEITTKYFLEPGFTVFLEWGWNTPNSMKGLVKPLTATNIAPHQNFDNLTARRRKSSGEYDNYLGYITGGGISQEGDMWIINVKCTGFTELPAYLVNGDNSGDGDGNPSKKSSDYQNLSFESDLNIKRWMFAFNALPSNRKTPEVKSLRDKYDSSLRMIPIANVVNYINFDSTIADKINAKADGTWLGRNTIFGSKGAKQTQDGKTVSAEVPAGTKIVGDEKFIRFGTLMEIFNTMIMKGLKVGKENVSMYIHSDTTTCSAFDTIFSTDKSKLFIPNNKTPKFSLLDAKNSTKPLTKVPEDSIVNNSVTDKKGITIQFPFEGSITDSYVEKFGQYVSYVDTESTKNNGVNKDERQWGLLDDLYVNFDFAKGILEASNFTVKDALYQILNGMSSAVNNLWNFQILQIQAPNTTVIQTDSGDTTIKKGDDILAIREVNFTYKPKDNKPYQFSLIGTDSIFKDSSLDMDMSGAKMNQVIGTRISTKINKDTSPNMGKLFAEGLTDLVLAEINSKKEIAGDDDTKAGTETDEELKKKNYADFLGKLGTYPKVHLERSDIESGFDINKVTYVSTYEDSQLLKLSKEKEETKVSILLPINFSFSIHGISGIKRGDKFRVIGIPDKYYKQGFFQVLGVKHTIQNMEWVTQVEGGYRNTSY